MGWSYACASVRGTSHVRSATRLQDARICRAIAGPDNDARFFGIVADGAGSADFGGEGASLACRIIGQLCSETLRSEQGMPDDEVIWGWIDEARDRLHQASSNRGVVPRQFATTLVMVIVSKSEIVTVHIGDGAIVARKVDDGGWSLLSAPQNGEYASTTYFLTDDPAPELRIDRRANVYDALAVFSDGIENLVLDSVTHEPSSAFFGPMIRPLEASADYGYLRGLSQGLASFLDSPRVNERTDDDKTLIMAVSR